MWPYLVCATRLLALVSPTLRHAAKPGPMVAATTSTSYDTCHRGLRICDRQCTVAIAKQHHYYTVFKGQVIIIALGRILIEPWARTLRWQPAASSTSLTAVSMNCVFRRDNGTSARESYIQYCTLSAKTWFDDKISERSFFVWSKG